MTVTVGEYEDVDVDVDLIALDNKEKEFGGKGQI